LFELGSSLGTKNKGKGYLAHGRTTFYPFHGDDCAPPLVPSLASRLELHCCKTEEPKRDIAEPKRDIMSKASVNGNVLVNKAAAPSLLPLLNKLRRRGFKVIESKTLAVTLLFPKTKQAFLVATHDFTPARFSPRVGQGPTHLRGHARYLGPVPS